MPHDEPVRTPRKASVRNQRHVIAQARAHDHRRGREHLRHAGTAFGPLITDDDNASLPDIVSLHRTEEVLLAVEHHRGPGEPHALLACDLCHRALRRQISSQDPQMARGLDRPIHRPDHLLPFVEPGQLGQVLRNRPARYRQAVAVQQAVLQQVLHRAGRSAHVVQILHDELSAGLEVRQQWYPVAHRLKIVDCQRDADGFRNCDHVQHRVGRSAKGHDHDHRVFERLAGHNVPRLDVLLQQVPDGRAGLEALLQLSLVHGRRRGTVGQRHAHRFDGGGHGIRGIHPPARAGARAGVLHNALPPLLVQFAGQVLAVALKSGHDVELLLVAEARFDGPSVDHQ